MVSLGSAGSRRLERTEVYQAVSVVYRDMDASPFGFEKGATPFLDLPATLPLPFRIPGVKEATISTGATIIAGPAFEAVAEDMVDMETFACMRACQVFGVPLIGLRGISDGDTDVDHIGDWMEYLHVIDEKLAQAVASWKRHCRWHDRRCSAARLDPMRMRSALESNSSSAMNWI